MSKDNSHNKQQPTRPTTPEQGRTLDDIKGGVDSERYKRSDVTNTMPPPSNPDRDQGGSQKKGK